MLMDLFYENLDCKKRRVHFHDFLLDVHRRIHSRKQEHLATFGRSAHIELQPERDIIGMIAREIAEESPVLCFDEFQVIDIADAMIMRKFFGVLFQVGSVVVATSNTHPKVRFLLIEECGCKRRQRRQHALVNTHNDVVGFIPGWRQSGILFAIFRSASETLADIMHGLENGSPSTRTGTKSQFLCLRPPKNVFCRPPHHQRHPFRHSYM